jgi:hypothetical protein
MYQKSDKPGRMEKENKRLEIIMSQYWNDLNGSFEYLDKIKDTPPFKEFYKIIEKKLTIEGMHPIQKPEKVLEPSKTSDTVEKKEEGKEEKKEKVQFFKPQSINQAEAEKKEEKEVTNSAALVEPAKATNSATVEPAKAINSTTVEPAKATNNGTNNATKTTNSATVEPAKATNSATVEPVKATNSAIVEPAKATNSAIVEPAKAEAKVEAKAPMPPTI